MADARPTPGELADTLRKLRVDAQLSGMKAGQLAGMSQPTISRYERGKVVPTEDDVRKLAEVYGARAATTRKLIRLVKTWRDQTTVPARVVMHRGAGDMQRRIGDAESGAKLIRQFHPAAVLGLLQLRDYARVIFGSGNDLPPAEQDAALDQRMARQDVLIERGREFTLLLTEGALRWNIGGPQLMAEQLDHIVERSRLPAVRVGIIPWTTPVDVAPMHGFDVYDESAAIVGTETATAFLIDPHDVSAYVKLFTDLEALASFGDDARAILADRAARYRALV